MIPIEITREDKILIVAPHPDDECIGGGGIIAIYSNQCDVILLTDGAHGQSGVVSEHIVKIREKEFEDEMQYARINNYKMFHLEDGTLFRNLEVFSTFDFSVYTKVFVTSESDKHPDHRAAFHAVKNALYKQNSKNMELYQMEVNAPIAQPTHYLDITNYIEKKKNLISFHKSQIKDRDYREMAEMLALYRGYQAGLNGRCIECFYDTDLEVSGNSDRYEKELSLQKYTSFYRIQNLWLYCRNKQYHIANYLSDMGYKNIAIYGYGDLGKRLREELEGTKVERIFVVDKRADKWNDSTIVMPDEMSEEIDLMIVTAFAKVMEIQKSIKVHCAVKPLSTILNEMVTFYEE